MRLVFIVGVLMCLLFGCLTCVCFVIVGGCGVDFWSFTFCYG